MKDYSESYEPREPEAYYEEKKVDEENIMDTFDALLSRDVKHMWGFFNGWDPFWIFVSGAASCIVLMVSYHWYESFGCFTINSYLKNIL